MLQGLGIAMPTTLRNETTLYANPIEIYRDYLVDILTKLIPETSQAVAYDAIQWSNSLLHGDLVRGPLSLTCWKYL